MTQETTLPAIMGGRPVFSSRLPMVKPEGLPGKDVLEEFESILRSGIITNGEKVAAFEQAASHYLGVPHCVAVSSCTVGLMLTLRALEVEGEVILPSFTFHATAHAVAWNQLKPVFADCDPETFCLHPEAVEERITPHTAAILAVHMYGHPVDVDALESISTKRRIPLLFDAAHAFGSRIEGRCIGSSGTAEVFSLSPTKLLVAAEGGLIATRDATLAHRLRSARNYGDAGNYDPELLGINGRMSELHAALALSGLDGLEERIERRNTIRSKYEAALEDLPGLHFQRIRSNCSSACKDFSVLVDEEVFGVSRDWVFDALQQENIDVRRYFDPPVHRQRLYEGLWDRCPLRNTDRVSRSVISLPIYSSLTDEQVDGVVRAVTRLHRFVETRHHQGVGLE